jgi:dienelactone hydrolase
MRLKHKSILISSIFLVHVILVHSAAVAVYRQDCDFDYNGKVDIQDFQSYAQRWLEDECSLAAWCLGTDINRDDVNDIIDFTEFAAAYGGIPWDIDQLFNAPQYTRAPELDKSGASAIFYIGPQFQGRPTRVFAWYGLPEGEGPFPGIVVVHGGGGTANADWVAQWNARGYAAISLDTTGSIPSGNFPGKIKDTQGGPDGWGGFNQIDWKYSDQWAYHAAANIISAHSFLRSLPCVDGNRTGIVGISWGGYLTSLVSGVDNRFAFAIPIYGCGYLYENSGWNAVFASMSRRAKDRWANLWDPSSYLDNAQMPMLWLNGTNDPYFPPDSYKKSYSLVNGPVNLAIKVRLIHNHNAVTDNQEVYAFADSICKGGSPIPVFTDVWIDDGRGYAAYSPTTEITSAVLVYTADTGEWKDRYWQSFPAQVDSVNNLVWAELPQDAGVWFFNITDSYGNISSSPHQTGL